MVCWRACMVCSMLESLHGLFNVGEPARGGPGNVTSDVSVYNHQKAERKGGYEGHIDLLNVHS